jgi:hypothetical protein
VRGRLTTSAVFCIGLVLAVAASSATLDELEITHSRGRYELSAYTYLAAPAPEIYAVLLDYEDNRFSRISSAYKESRYLEPDTDGTPIVYTLMEGCVLHFCRSLRRVERLEIAEPTFIRTTLVPERSDFDYATSEWTLEPVEGGTQVTYELVMKPAFWVPPVVGPWLLKRRLREGGVRALTRIERLAQGEALPKRIATSE